MSKKKTLILIMALACICFAVSGTLAFFTAQETAHNVISSGSVDIELIEQAKTDNGMVPFENVDGIMPGMELSKIVSVKNTGASPAWIRVAVQKSISLAPGVEGEVDLGLVTLDVDTASWTYKDGFYYYNAPLAPGEITASLFSTVTFDESMGNLYQNSKAHIYVKADAVQVANNGSTVFEALGWLEEPET